MKDKRKKVAAILWLLAIVALNSYVLWKNGKNLVNADDSSELVLASLLSGGNGFISRGWVYSSELRVLNTRTAGQLCVLWATWRWMDGFWALIGFSWGS